MIDQRWIAAAAMWVFASASLADSGGETAATSEPPTTAAGQKIFVDPNTGELRAPDASDWLQLPAPVQSKAKVVPQVLPDGTIVIPADAVMQEISATIEEDGSLQVRCDDEPAGR